MLHHPLQASLEAITEILLLVFVIWLQSLARINCSLQPSESNSCGEYTRLFSEANVTQSYICKLTSMGCAERPLSLAAQFSFNDVGTTGISLTDAPFGFRLLGQIHRLSLWWILLVTFAKLLLHIYNRILLLILSDIDICGLY
jgi:hypothetical protein